MLECEYCGKNITNNVYVINRRTWCENCFNTVIIKEIKMPVEQFEHRNKELEMEEKRLEQQTVSKFY